MKTFWKQGEGAESLIDTVKYFEKRVTAKGERKEGAAT